MRSKNHRLLIAAIGVSLLTHMLIASVLRPHVVVAASEPIPRHIDIIHLRVPKPTPTPHPTPPPKPPEKKAVIKPHAPEPPALWQTSMKNRHEVTIVAAGPGVIAPPFPSANTGQDTGTAEPPTGSGPKDGPPPIIRATPSCAAPDEEAHVKRTVQLQEPQVAREQGLAGTTQVEVSLASDGSVERTSVYRSSGSTLLDDAALIAARETTYAAAESNCRSVSGSYLFTAEFD